MSKRTERIARKLGAKVVAKLPETGGGAFGAARLAALRARLQPQVGLRPGRPTESSWSVRRKIPMSPATYKRLQTDPLMVCVVLYVITSAMSALFGRDIVGVRHLLQQRRQDGKDQPDADGIEHDGDVDDNKRLAHGALRSTRTSDAEKRRLLAGA